MPVVICYLKISPQPILENQAVEGIHQRIDYRHGKQVHKVIPGRTLHVQIKEGREGARRILLPVSVVFILVFWAWFERLQSVLGVSVFLVGLVVAIYLFFWGVSAWLIL